MFLGLDLVLLSLNHMCIEIHEKKSNFRNHVMVGFPDGNKTVTITKEKLHPIFLQ